MAKFPLPYDFWCKVKKTDSCWVWVGTIRQASGYGAFCWKKYTHYPHRLILESEGYDLTDKVILHDCDNRKCCNPAHLTIGTDADNVKDKCDKLRQCRGETHGISKLTENDVREIRKQLSEGKMQKEIAVEFDITQPLVSKIHNKVVWGWL